MFPIIKKGSLALLAQALMSGSNFAISILLARWLAPGQYGAYTLVFSIFFFVSSFHSALLLEPMGVLGPASYRECLGTYVGRLIQLHFMIAMSLAGIMAIAASLGRFLGAANGVSAALWGACVGIPWILFYFVLRQAAYIDLRPELVVRGSAVYAIVVLSILFFFRSSSWLNPFSAFLIQTAGSICAAILLFVWMRPRLKSRPELAPMRAVWRQHWTYGRWVVLTTFVYWLSAQAFYFLAAALLRMEDVGTLSALQNFVAPLTQFVTASSLLLLPWTSGRFTNNDQASFQRLVKGITLLFIGAGVAYVALTIVAGKWLIVFFYHGKYAQSARLIPLFALSGAFIAASQGPAIGLRAMQAPSRIFTAYSVAAVFSLLIGFALTKWWGLAGNVLGLAASSLCFLVTVTCCYQSKLRQLTLGNGSKRILRDPVNTRVAWLIPSLARGNYMQPLFSEFTKLFPRTIVFTGLWNGFANGYEGTFSLRCLSGYKFVAFKKGKNGYGRGFFWAPFAAVRELLTFRPNVIFASGFSIWTLYALAFRALSGCRVIILWEGTTPTVAYLDSPVRLAVRRFMTRLADAGISNMRAGIEYLRDVLAAPDFKLLHHPYEVPEPSLLSSGVEDAGLQCLPRPVFLFVGSIISRKGWTRLIDAAASLVQRGCSSFSVLIVGTGEEEGDLRERIWSHGLERIVHVAGPVAYANLGAYYRACDVFVFPTYEDTWGLVLLEAMAFGKAVLCSKFAGSREMVRHGVNGFVFDPHDREELAQYMARFIENPRLGQEFGKRSAEGMAPYTPLKAANVLAGLVTEVAERKSGTVPLIPAEVTSD
jgi:glycosyltransferase involved in cell wall biosynthesis/O-antigen/teichoic acid export membrane protein